MLIFIKDCDSKVHSIECSPSDTICVIKKIIEKTIQVPASLQRLIFAGKQLENNRTMSEYCIQKESTLHLIQRRFPKRGEGRDLDEPSGSNIETANTRKAKKAKQEEGRNSMNHDDSDRVGRGDGLGISISAPKKEFLVDQVDFIDPGEGGVTSFPLFTNIFCSTLLKQVEEYIEQTGDSGVALGLRHLSPLDSVISSLLLPILPFTGTFHLLPKVMFYTPRNSPSSPSSSSSISSTKKAGKNCTSDWPLHCDGDIATINVCLSSDFQGGLVRFFPKMKDPHLDHHLHLQGGEEEEEKQSVTSSSFELEHRTVGRAIVHHGDLVHCVTPVISGKRCTLIIKVKKGDEPQSLE